MIGMKCGCGKEVRYILKDKDGNIIGSCNKYQRCLTPEEIEKREQQKKILDTWGMMNI